MAAVSAGDAGRALPQLQVGGGTPPAACHTSPVDGDHMRHMHGGADVCDMRTSGTAARSGCQEDWLLWALGTVWRRRRLEQRRVTRRPGWLQVPAKWAWNPQHAAL